jgi:CBS domain containing-hemolysin-like protein
MSVFDKIKEVFRKFLFWVVSKNLHSRRDLVKIISTTTAIPNSDKQLILSAAKFPWVKLTDIMTPKSEISFVRDTIQLGPKVLDELYATGQKIFPVAHRSLDDAIGVIYLEDITIVAKGEQTLSQATHLRPPVLAQELSANEALVEMLLNNANLAMVSDSNDKIIGIIELVRIFETLLGRKLS